MKTIKIWEIKDTEDLAKALNNKRIQDNLRDGLPLPYTVDDAKDFITSMLNADKATSFSFAITKDGTVVGSIGVFRQENIHYRTAEVGYYIAEPYWGMGLATKAINEVCSYIFNNTNIIRIYAEPFANNTASCRVLEKSGFTLEGTLRKNAEKNGKLIDMKMYAVIKETFL